MLFGEAARPVYDKVKLTPIVGLVENLSELEIRQLTVQAIKTHRELIAKSEATECSLGTEDNLAQVQALIDMHAQASVVSTLIDILGYIPDMD